MAVSGIVLRLAVGQSWAPGHSSEARKNLST